MSFNREQELISTLVAQFTNNITEFVRCNLFVIHMARLVGNVALVNQGETTHRAIVKLLEEFKANEAAPPEPVPSTHSELIKEEIDLALGNRDASQHHPNETNTSAAESSQGVDQKSIAIDAASSIVNQIDSKRMYDNFQRAIASAKQRDIDECSNTSEHKPPHPNLDEQAETTPTKRLRGVLPSVGVFDDVAFQSRMGQVPVNTTPTGVTDVNESTAHSETSHGYIPKANLPTSISSSAAEGYFVPQKPGEQAISTTNNSTQKSEYDLVLSRIEHELFFPESEVDKFPHVLTTQGGAVWADSRNLYRLLQAAYPNVKAVRANSDSTHIAVAQINAIYVLTAVKKDGVLSVVITNGSTNELEVLRPDTVPVFQTALNELAGSNG